MRTESGGASSTSLCSKFISVTSGSAAADRVPARSTMTNKIAAVAAIKQRFPRSAIASLPNPHSPSYSVCNLYTKVLLSPSRAKGPSALPPAIRSVAETQFPLNPATDIIRANMLTVDGSPFRALTAAGAILVLILSACSGDDDVPESDATPSPTVVATPSPTPAEANPAEAEGVFERFVAAVQADDLDTAWSLYTASIPGTTEEHNASLGCSYSEFSIEFPRIMNLFAREVPFEVVEHFGGASPTSPVEIALTGATGGPFLVTLLRVEPHEPYRLRFMNNGGVATPGSIGALPSPGDPQGFCNIWNGGR